MPNRFAFPLAARLCLLAAMAASCARAQSVSDVLAGMDRFARTFIGARAAIRSTNHNQGAPEDLVDSGTIVLKRAAGKAQFLIHFTTPNNYSVAIREQTAEVYYPKINQINEYNLHAYKDIAQKLFLLGFGTPGRDLVDNYEVRTLKHQPLDGQQSEYLELIPKAPEVHKQLSSVEIWISDANHCPIRQTFHFPDGSYRMAEFSNVEVNPKLSGGAFDLPKGAKRVKMN